MRRKIFKVIRSMLIVFISFIVITLISAYFYLKQDKFGANPEGERLTRIQSSPNFKDGKFENVTPTPQLTEGYNMFEVLYEFIFKKSERQRPKDTIPSVKTDLRALPPDENILVWFGHSSYFMQIDGKKILVDPVLSGDASPLPGFNKAFPGTDIYSVDDLPDIDYLIITHDHYDHLDYPTIKELRPKVRKVLTGLGVGAHLELWGYPADMIIEKDWNETVELDPGFTAYIETARHFSGRTFSRNNTLWISILLQTPTMKIYLGGDSGYDKHYAEIGKKYGPIDFAILENGQYDIKWKYIHNLPHDVLLAGRDLNAVRIMPVHSAKFVMANHAWDEPLIRLTEGNKGFHLPLVTPMIGEKVYLNDTTQNFTRWWEGME